MSSFSWPRSPLVAAQHAFDLLTCPPTVLAVDGNEVVGLPARPVPLVELRGLLLKSSTAVAVRDAVWRDLVIRARRDGPAWVVVAVGMAMPGLRRAGGLLAAGWHGDTADLDAELIVGFVARLQTVDVDEPRICGRLIDAGRRAARKAREETSVVEVVPVQRGGPQRPVPPYDHPDLVLARAVVAGVLDVEEAGLIGATRLGHATLAQAADDLGVGVGLAASWRRTAEKRLVAAIRDGELDHVVLRPRRLRPGGVAVGRLWGSGPRAVDGSGTQQGPLVGTAAFRSGMSAGVPGEQAGPAGARS